MNPNRAYHQSNRGNGGYTQAPYNYQQPNYGRNDYQQMKPVVKHSGARIKDAKNGKPCISAWRKTRNAFMTLIACPNGIKNVGAKDGHKMINKRGEEYARWTGTLVERNTGSVSTVSCLYNLSTGKLYIPELKLVASPRANNGGYFGNSYVSKRR